MNIKTKLARLLLVIFLVSTVASLVVAYISKPSWPPHEHYYFTLTKPQVDMQLAPDLALVAWAPIDVGARDSLFLSRCDPARRSDDGGYPYYAYRHDIVLCNSTGKLIGSQFDVAFAQFTKLVDRQYLEYQARMAVHFSIHLLAALAFVAVCWLIAVTVKWISKGA